MIRFVFRFVGLWILAAGFVALVRDGTNAIAANSLDFTKLGTLNDDWTNIHGTSLDALKALVERYAGPRSGRSRLSMSCGCRRPGWCSGSSARSSS